MPNRFRIPALTVYLAGCVLLLSACGNKGSLTLPPKGDASAPASASNAAKKAADHNSQPTSPR